MGKVVELVRALVEKQVKEHGIVVWYDPERAYAWLVQELNLPGVEVEAFKETFFELRRRLEPRLEFTNANYAADDGCGVPPSLIVYVPTTREHAEYALIEAETAGIWLEPGAPVPDRNTRLSAFVERVFAQVTPERAAQLARQADEGILKLEELDRMAGEAGSPTAGALKLIFDHASADAIVLQFVASNAHDARILEKRALKEMADLASGLTGMVPVETKSTDALRAALRRHLLLGELALTLPPEPLAAGFTDLPAVPEPAHRDAIRHLVSAWRNRIDLQASYAEAASEAERSTGVMKRPMPPEALERLETFPFVERLLLSDSAKTLYAGDRAAVKERAAKRRGMFWSRVAHEIARRWTLIETGADLLQAADEIRESLKKTKRGAGEMIHAYASEERPWFRLDRLMRAFELHLALSEVEPEDEAALVPAVTLCRATYTQTVAQMTGKFVESCRAEGTLLSGTQAQSRIFIDRIRPRILAGVKTAYFLVDALRYEMAAELAEAVATDFEATLAPAVGMLPGVTTVGMAALMPEAEKGISLETHGEKLKVCIQGKAVTQRDARMKWMAEKAGCAVVACKLGDVVKPKPKMKKEIAEANLVVVTSQEIDRHGEENDEDEARIYMNDVLDKLRRGIRGLMREGVTEFVIAADHGFLSIEGLEDGLRMDPPGGQTVELHARAWIGMGGANAEGYYRLPASAAELGGPLELAFPAGLGLFKVKGGTGSYFHGGPSLQERVIPVLELKAKHAPRRVSVDLKVDLQLAKPSVTNRFFTVTVTLVPDSLFETESVGAEKRIRLEAMSDGDEVGCAVAATSGFEETTREIRLTTGEKNAVTMRITSLAPLNTIEIRAVDCETMLTLAELSSVPVNFAF